MEINLSAAAERNAAHLKLRHYRDVWGGNLPASVYSLKRYILAMAGLVDVKLIQSRVNAVCKWHRDNAQPDPGADQAVRNILRGVVKVHRYDHGPVEDTKTLTFMHLEKICHELGTDCTRHQGSTTNVAQAHRNLALCLLGFWGGFNGAQLSMLTAAHLHFPGTGGLDIAVPATSMALGQGDYSLHHIEELKKLCPVHALKKWLLVAGISHGPIFRPINRWGQLGADQLSLQGINSILKKVSGPHTDNSLHVSSKSLPRGFAAWARTHAWNDEAILDYLGVTTARSVLSLVGPRPKDFGSLSVCPDKEK